MKGWVCRVIPIQKWSWALVSGLVLMNYNSPRLCDLCLYVCVCVSSSSHHHHHHHHHHHSHVHHDHQRFGPNVSTPVAYVAWPSVPASHPRVPWLSGGGFISTGSSPSTSVTWKPQRAEEAGKTCDPCVDLKHWKEILFTLEGMNFVEGMGRNRVPRVTWNGLENSMKGSWLVGFKNCLLMFTPILGESSEWFNQQLENCQVWRFVCACVCVCVCAWFSPNYSQSGHWKVNVQPSFQYITDPNRLEKGD